jgi:hypothetical protein
LSDTGANGCAVGDNVSKPWKTDRFIDMMGIKNHTVSNLNIVHAAFVATAVHRHIRVENRGRAAVYSQESYTNTVQEHYRNPPSTPSHELIHT